jgi:hypothetical protein
MLPLLALVFEVLPHALGAALLTEAGATEPLLDDGPELADSEATVGRPGGRATAGAPRPQTLVAGLPGTTVVPEATDASSATAEESDSVGELVLCGGSSLIMSEPASLPVSQYQ